MSKPTHKKLLIASYFLGAVSTLLAALAAISAASENDKLLYPDINGQQPQTNPTSNARKYFDL
jgi:hypothetical protein